MQSVVKEDELMSRLEMLENQLQVYSRVSPYSNQPDVYCYTLCVVCVIGVQNSTDDELKKQLTLSFEEKHKAEATLKVIDRSTQYGYYYMCIMKPVNKGDLGSIENILY